MAHDSIENPGSPARILIVEAQPLLRLGLQVTLDQERELRVVGNAGDLDAAADACATAWPDIVLLDRSLVGGRGDALGFVKHLRRRLPDAKVILLAQGVDELDARRAMRAGAWGYLPITIAPPALTAAIRAVHAGEVALPRGLALQLLDEATAASAAS